MESLAEEIVYFFNNKGFVIVSTIDNRGYPHSSCKGIVEIERNGRIYLFDLYHGRTYDNLKKNPHISITAVDEHKFKGYCLKGKAKIIPIDKIKPKIITAWEAKIISRITQRLLKNVRGEKGHPRHPEASLPRPKYLILVEVEEIVDLIPKHIKAEG